MRGNHLHYRQVNQTPRTFVRVFDSGAQGHAQAVVSRRDGTAHGGFDSTTGLALIKL